MTGETKKPRVWTADESERHPGYFGIRENGGPVKGPLYTDKADAEKFCKRINMEEAVGRGDYRD